MKKKSTHRQAMTALLSLVLVAGFLSSCNKKKDASLTRSGGGVSSQSIVTLKGASQ